MLAYADDIVLVAESANELQTLHVIVKGDKTQIVHFRKLPISKATYDIVLRNQNICLVNNHKYLDLILTECLDYMEMVKNQ